MEFCKRARIVGKHEELIASAVKAENTSALKTECLILHFVASCSVIFKCRSLVPQSGLSGFLPLTCVLYAHVCSRCYCYVSPLKKQASHGSSLRNLQNLPAKVPFPQLGPEGPPHLVLTYLPGFSYTSPLLHPHMLIPLQEPPTVRARRNLKFKEFNNNLYQLSIAMWQTILKLCALKQDLPFLTRPRFVWLFCRSHLGSLTCLHGWQWGWTWSPWRSLSQAWGLGAVSWGASYLLHMVSLHEMSHSPVFSTWPLSPVGYSGLPYTWLPIGERQKLLGLLKLRPVSCTTSLVPHCTGQSNHRASPDRLCLLKREVAENLWPSLISHAITFLLHPPPLILTIITQCSFLE